MAEAASKTNSEGHVSTLDPLVHFRGLAASSPEVARYASVACARAQGTPLPVLQRLIGAQLAVALSPLLDRASPLSQAKPTAPARPNGNSGAERESSHNLNDRWVKNRVECKGRCTMRPSEFRANDDLPFLLS
jgi:hypothetical protein